MSEIHVLAFRAINRDNQQDTELSVPQLFSKILAGALFVSMIAHSFLGQTWVLIFSVLAAGGYIVNNLFTLSANWNNLAARYQNFVSVSFFYFITTVVKLLYLPQSFNHNVHLDFLFETLPTLYILFLCYMFLPDETVELTHKAGQIGVRQNGTIEMSTHSGLEKYQDKHDSDSEEYKDNYEEGEEEFDEDYEYEYEVDEDEDGVEESNFEGMDSFEIEMRRRQIASEKLENGDFEDDGPELSD
jgi:hypothetical protein